MIRRLLLWCVGCALTVALCGTLVIERLALSPRQLAPYIAQRSSGHSPWIGAAGQSLAAWLMRADRGPQIPAADYPAWAGVGKPATAPKGRMVIVGDAINLQDALAQAEPGDVITLLPGSYRFAGISGLDVSRAGRADAPIVLRANAPGEAMLEFAMTEGFQVQAPYWRFENLDIRGRCDQDDDCEHAFHVTGKAHHTVIDNNRIEDFNAHLKINGHAGFFPDGGVITRNTLVNSRVRRTGRPVTPIDLVAASGWRIEGNLIADFIKAGSDRVSYGAFVKGGGSNNRLLRNVVLCEHRLRGFAGQRVGLSLGGGGTNPLVCRDKACVVEQEGSVMAGNLIAQCSDEGIYINRAAQSVLANNTVLDTAGVSVRYPETGAELVGNIVDGKIRVRDEAIMHAHDNRSTGRTLAFLGVHRVRSLYLGSENLDLRWRSGKPMRETAVQGEDLCIGPMSRSVLGATEDFSACLAKESRK